MEFQNRNSKILVMVLNLKTVRYGKYIVLVGKEFEISICFIKGNLYQQNLNCSTKLKKFIFIKSEFLTKSKICLLSVVNVFVSKCRGWIFATIKLLGCIVFCFAVRLGFYYNKMLKICFTFLIYVLSFVPVFLNLC